MRLKIAVLALALVLVPAMAMAQAPSQNIMAILSADNNFSTFTTLLKDAGIKDLTMEGPFRVFAPTNAAFAKVPADVMDKLKKDNTLLRKVLYFHIVPGKYTMKDMTELKECRTLCPTAGGVALLDMKVDKNSGKLISVDGAKVVKADIPASNGIIQEIDAVMLTPLRTPIK
jgi:transforming growth factor-beta-induced protein